MAARSRETAAARKARQAAEKPPAGDAQEGMPDGVLLIKTVEEDGTLTVTPQTLGNVQVTEVQTLLEIGLKVFRQNIGLDERK